MYQDVQLKCPHCQKPMTVEEKNMDNNPFFPFCSKSCKMVDLDKWFCEEFSIGQSMYELDEDQLSDLLDQENR